MSYNSTNSRYGSNRARAMPENCHLTVVSNVVSFRGPISSSHAQISLVEGLNLKFSTSIPIIFTRKPPTPPPHLPQCVDRHLPKLSIVLVQVNMT